MTSMAKGERSLELVQHFISIRIRLQGITDRTSREFLDLLLEEERAIQAIKEMGKGR